MGVCGTHGAMGNSSVPQDGLGDKRQINGLLQEKQRGREREKTKQNKSGQCNKGEASLITEVPVHNQLKMVYLGQIEIDESEELWGDELL